MSISHVCTKGTHCRQASSDQYSVLYHSMKNKNLLSPIEINHACPCETKNDCCMYNEMKHIKEKSQCSCGHKNECHTYIHKRIITKLHADGDCTKDIENRGKKIAGYTFLVVGACTAAPLLLFTIPAAAVVALAVLAGICALIGIALLAIVSKNSGY